MIEQIHIKHKTGRVLLLDEAAAELFTFLSFTYHDNTAIQKPYTSQPASVAYTFATLSFLWRYKMMSDDDFQFFGRLPLAEQYEIALRYTATCYELMQLELTMSAALRQFDKLLQDNQDNI